MRKFVAVSAIGLVTALGAVAPAHAEEIVVSSPPVVSQILCEYEVAVGFDLWQSPPVWARADYDCI